MSKIQVDAIEQQTACGTTLTAGGGAGKTVVVDATTVTLGRCGGTVALASGASQTGFGRSGSVNWDTTPKTATFTAADGVGYFINSGSAITANLPAGVAGAIVAFSDYARNFSTYNFTISANGSEKIGGQVQDAVLNVDGQAATFVYTDATKGWINVQNAEDTTTGVPPFICATGGTITTNGNDRIHTFTGPGTFTVNTIATCCAAVNNLVSYMVIAGGGGGGGYYTGGGGGAGGYREVVSPGSPYTGSPTQGYSTPGNRITVTATNFPITIGAGGGGGATGSGANIGTQGSASTFSTISSAGGGFGVGYSGGGTVPTGGPGGSGGGGTGNCGTSNGGSGNTPPTTPSQGSNGGNAQAAPSDRGAGGGGGATAVGQAGQPSPGTGGAGGAGATSSINGTPTARAGGGGGGSGQSPISPAPVDGGGKGGLGSAPAPGAPGTAGTNNTGGGGGGAGASPTSIGAEGGSGIVIIRYRFQ